MSLLSEIKESIQAIARTAMKRTLVFNAEVVSVEGDTCTVLYKELSLSNVRLTPVNDANKTKLIVTPAKNSWVSVFDGSHGELRDLSVIKFSEVESIMINGGENGGLINVKDLVTKINSCESKVNEILTTLKKIIIPLAPTGSYPLSSDFVAVKSLSKTSVKDIEDTKITH